MLNFETEISFNELRKYWIKSETLPVLHCGAHLGEERFLYFEFQMLPVTWIESGPHLIDSLRENVMQLPCQNVIEATLWSTSNVKMKLNIANNSFSSSLLNLEAASYLYPEISITESIEVLTTAIDDLEISRQSLDGGLLVLDLQGVELEVLKGAVKTLDKSNYILCEVSNVEMYRNQPLWPEINEFLKIHCLTLIDFQIDEEKGWGNALYRKGRAKIFDSVMRKRRQLTRKDVKQKIFGVGV
jgi:FkbM family methyltransferase